MIQIIDEADMNGIMFRRNPEYEKKLADELNKMFEKQRLRLVNLRVVR